MPQPKPVPFHDISQGELTARLTINSIRDKIEKRKTASCTSSSVIYCVNDLAGFAIFDAMDELRRSPLFKREVKFYANLVSKSFDKYERETKWQFRDDKLWQLYLDLADGFQSFMQPHVMKLRLAALNKLTSMDIPHRATLSYVITAQSMLVFACETFNGYFNAQRSALGVDAREEYSFLHLSAERRLWRKLTDILIPFYVEKNISQDHDFQLACQIICRQSYNDGRLNSIAKDAMDKNETTVNAYLTQGKLL